MEGLICYASKYGSTLDVCEDIKRGMEGNVRIRHISEVDRFDYDIIVIGSPVFIGKPMQSMIDFIVSNESNFRDKNLAIFVTCWAASTIYHQASTQFVELITKYLPACNIIHSGGLPGRLLPDQISTRDRNALNRLLRRIGNMSGELNDEHIQWKDARNPEINREFGSAIVKKLKIVMSIADD